MGHIIKQISDAVLTGKIHSFSLSLHHRSKNFIIGIYPGKERPFAEYFEGSTLDEAVNQIKARRPDIFKSDNSII